MAFNMLDDDFITEDNAYTPSFSAASRTGSMKKFAKKQERPNTAAVLQKPTTMKEIQKDEFDDLLNELIDSKEKSAAKRPNTSISVPKKGSILDDLKFSTDSAFEHKESITFNYQKTLPKPLEASKFNQMTNSKDTFKLSDDFGTSTLNKNTFAILEDQDASPSGRRRESSLRKDSPKNVVQDDAPSMTIGSSRMMRPPLGRKPSGNNIETWNKPDSLGLTLNEDVSKLSQTAEPAKFGAPSSRRGSSAAQTPKDSFGFLKQKQELKFPIPNVQDEPRLSRNSSLQFPDRTSQQRIHERIVQRPVERVVQKIVQRVIQAPKVDTSAMRLEHQKQLSLVKQSYEKQIKILTENYERQLREEKEAKSKVMSDVKEMMEKERDKNEKILKEETERVKKMNDWEKQKLETTYQSEIERLKGIVSAQEKSIPEPSVSYLEKRRIQDLEQKLKYQLESVQNEKKKLGKIEADLEQRQTEFSKFRAAEEKRLKEECLKNNDKSFKDLKRISQERNEIAAEKQKIALEMAQLQMDILQKQEKLSSQEQLLKAHQQSFQRTKQDSESLNQQLYTSYKLKLQEAEQSKNNALLLQNDLLNKLKIVQLKGKQVYKGEIDNPIFRNTFQGNRTGVIPPRPQSVTQSRFVPQDNSKRVKNIETYVKSQNLALGNSNKFSTINNSTFTLDKFIKNIDAYKKEKREMIY